jgi:hypothetical protein
MTRFVRHDSFLGANLRVTLLTRVHELVYSAIRRPARCYLA